MNKKIIVTFIIALSVLMVSTVAFAAVRWMSLKEMTKDPNLDNKLRDNVPRKVLIEVPKRYISKVHIYYGDKGNKIDNVTLTSIDIFPTESWNIDSIYVEAVRLYDNGDISEVIKPSRKAERAFDMETGQIYWNVGFAGLDTKDNIDIEITVKNRSKVIVQTLYVRLAPGEKETAPKESLESTYERGYKYTLHDLIADEKFFNELLKWYNLNEIKGRFQY